VQSAEQDPVGVEHVDQSGQAETEPIHDDPGPGSHRRVRGVLEPEQGGGLLERGDAGKRLPARRVDQAQGVGLHVQAAAAAAPARPAPRIDADVTCLHAKAGTAGVERAVEHEGAANAPVTGRHHQQVPGLPAGAVPVLGQRGQVDVVGGQAGRRGSARPADPGPFGLRSEDVPDPDAGRPAEVQRPDRRALRLGHRGRHGQAGPHAGPARRPQQPRARLRDRAQRALRVVGRGQPLVLGRDYPAAQPDQRDLEPVRVDLGGQGHRAVGIDDDPVRGPAQDSATRGFRVRVHLDEPPRLQFGRDRARGGPGHAEGGAQGRPGGCPPAVDQRQGRTELGAPARGPGRPRPPCRGCVLVHSLILCR
jgi:hypothetical protein